MLDWVAIKAKSRKGLKIFRDFAKNFNFDLFISDKHNDLIIDGHCEFNLKEVMKNDRYKLDK